jgi:methylmalonyl-CoA mutase N-terminal domain/subunit
MIFRTRALAAIAAASLLATAACENAVNSNETGEGSVTFSYTGEVTGSFNATGGYDRLRPNASNWAVGNRGTLESGEDAIGIYARADRAADNLVDDFLLLIQEPRVGSFVCTDETADTCPLAAFLILGTTPTSEDSEAIYASVQGTVNITTINEDRATGNFVLTMEPFTLEEAVDSVQVTSGTFNVPIVRGIN